MTMIDNDKDNLPVAGDAATDATRADSLLQQAARKRSEREATLFLELPSWDGGLMCEYRLLAPEEVTQLAHAQMRALRSGATSSARMKLDIDLIARCAVGLYAVDPETGEKVAVEDEFGHVGYDRIAEKFHVERTVTSNSDAIRYMFGEPHADGTWDDNITAIGQHAQAISRWMKDPGRRSVDLEELLGELG